MPKPSLLLNSRGTIKPIAGNVGYWEKQTILMYKDMISASFCFLLLRFVRKRGVGERIEDSWILYTQKRRCVFFCETSLPFYFVLLSRYWYRANLKHLILSDSSCIFRGFLILLSLVPLNLGPSSARPRVTWCLVTLQFALSFSPWFKNLPGFYNFLDSYVIFYVTLLFGATHAIHVFYLPSDTGSLYVSQPM